MDVDDPMRMFADEVVGQDLHVSGKHDKFDPVFGERCHDRPFLLRLGVRGDREVDVWQTEVFAEIAMIGMVRHHDADVDRERARPPPTEHVIQAVRLARGEQRRRDEFVSEVQRGVHVEATGDRREGVEDGIAIDSESIEIELDALKEECFVAAAVDVLLGVNDVAIVFGNECRGG